MLNYKLCICSWSHGPNTNLSTMATLRDLPCRNCGGCKFSIISLGFLRMANSISQQRQQTLGIGGIFKYNNFIADFPAVVAK